MYELWFRMPYRGLIAEGAFTAAVRPGDRRAPQPKGTEEGTLAAVRILEKPGDEETGIVPVFNDLSRKARIDRIVVKQISELHPEDLARCSPDSRSREAVIYHLGLIYNREFAPSETVSILYFTYL